MRQIAKDGKRSIANIKGSTGKCMKPQQSWAQQVLYRMCKSSNEMWFLKQGMFNSFQAFGRPVVICSTKYFAYILIVSVSVIPDDLFATKKVHLVNIFARLVVAMHTFRDVVGITAYHRKLYMWFVF
jgi:hypothetical protein